MVERGEPWGDGRIARGRAAPPGRGPWCVVGRAGAPARLHLARGLAGGGPPPKPYTHQVDGHGQDAIALIVDVLADQVHATWHGGKQCRRAGLARLPRSASLPGLAAAMHPLNPAHFVLTGKAMPGPPLRVPGARARTSGLVPNLVSWALTSAAYRSRASGAPAQEWGGGHIGSKCMP